MCRLDIRSSRNLKKAGAGHQGHSAFVCYYRGLHKRSILSIQLRFRWLAKAAQPQVMGLVLRLPNLTAIGPLLPPG